MEAFLKYIKDISKSKSLKKKIMITLMLLLLYRLLVILPVPFVNLSSLMELLNSAKDSWWVEYLTMLMWWTLERFSIIAVWLVPFINASIIMQLLTAVLPQLEELQEQWESWNMKIQQYTRWLTIPFALLQSVWMVYLINSLYQSASWPLIDIASSKLILLWAAFVLTVWTVILMYIWELITEKWISNWVSLIIFSSIVSWITWKLFTWFTWSNSLLALLVFMTIVVLFLVIVSVLLIRTRKEIPIVYSRQWKVEETATLPIPLNPVWMIPIIFAMAFTSFPYLLSQVINKMQVQPWLSSLSSYIETNFNIYSNQPTLITVFIYFLFIVMFTFFYTLIVFNPEKIADNIQKRWWFVPWIRPWEETAKYLNKILMHLCLWGWMWLWFIWIYSYVLSYLPFMQTIASTLWSIPVLVSWSWVIIVVWVVQDLIQKIDAELLMERYERV